MSEFEISRSATMAADPARVHALVNDFHEWPAWSPWEDLDPDMQRTYTGPRSGAGSHYSWSGNRKAGAGSMEITEVTPEEIGIRLEFLKPWRASNGIRFVIVPTTGGAQVTWSMTGERRGLSGVAMRVFNMDRLVGRDFEKGLARLQAVCEGDPAPPPR